MGLQEPGKGAGVPELFRMLYQACQLINGKLLTITLDGSTDLQEFDHGLGRAYRGGFVVGDGSTTAANQLKVLSGLRAQANGTDIKRKVLVRPTAATATTWLVWCF